MEMRDGLHSEALGLRGAVEAVVPQPDLPPTHALDDTGVERSGVLAVLGELQRHRVSLPHARPQSSLRVAYPTNYQLHPDTYHSRPRIRMATTTDLLLGTNPTEASAP